MAIFFALVILFIALFLMFADKLLEGGNLENVSEDMDSVMAVSDCSSEFKRSN